MSVIEETGWVDSTYRSHEQGTRKFDEETAQKYGRRFHVNWLWLLCYSDEGGPRSVRDSQGHDGAGGAADMPLNARLSEIALRAADQIAEMEARSGEDRISRVAKLQVAIYKFLEAQEAKGLLAPEDMARRIMDLMLETRE